MASTEIWIKVACVAVLIPFQACRGTKRTCEQASKILTFIHLLHALGKELTATQVKITESCSG